MMALRRLFPLLLLRKPVMSNKKGEDVGIQSIVGGTYQGVGMPAAGASSLTHKKALTTVDGTVLTEPLKEYSYDNTLASLYFQKGTEESRANIKSFGNRVHIALGYTAGLCAYSFGSAMHVSGQGSALTMLTMTGAGTMFFLNAQNRNVNGPTDNIFVFEAVAAWMWMLCSFQQFNATKKLKYAGYSSWMGLVAATYYSTQHMLSGDGKVEEKEDASSLSLHEKIAKEIEGVANAAAHKRA